MLLSTSAMAEWTLVSIDSELTAYADLSSIRKTDNGFRMWSLFDLNSEGEFNKKKYLSMRMLFEFDCNNERQRTLSTSIHRGSIASGAIIDSSRDWTSPAFVDVS